jgi:hypothetical protein
MISLDPLKSFCEDDTSFFNTMKELLLEELLTSNELFKFSENLEAKASAIHRLKPKYGMFGLYEVESELKSLELDMKAGKDRDLEYWIDINNQLIKLLQEV